MIAAGQCLNFSVCLFVLNLFFICFLKTANVFPLSSQLTMKINDLYIVFTSIFLIFSGQGRLLVSRPMMLLFLSALIMHVSKKNLF